MEGKGFLVGLAVVVAFLAMLFGIAVAGDRPMTVAARTASRRSSADRRCQR